jgi:8-amino-7-oxononanoate synthase
VPLDLDALLLAELAQLEAAGRLRACPALAGASRLTPTLRDAPLLNFASNDYLGLADHPALRAAATAMLAQGPVGAAASRLVSGDFPEHRTLEAAIASFLERPAALLFPTGYQTNMGVITSLAGRGDLIVSDAANHASLIDGCRLSRATVRVYPHLDVAAAAAALRDGPGPFRRRWLVTESLFSMDGDLAPIADLAETADRAGAALIVDEAHALGVLGPSGRGWCAAQGVTPHVLIGTLGKAFGTAGGFATGSVPVRAYLVNRARTFLFTTASPPSIAAASQAAIPLVAGPSGDGLRARLRDNIAALTASVPRPGHPPSATPTPIVPVILGPDRAALAAGDHLREAGFFVQPIRPPTVPEGTSRLRITLSAAHTPAQVAGLAGALRTLLARA